MTTRAPYTCLWFQKDADLAARRYVELIPNSRVLSEERAPADNPSQPQGALLMVNLELDGTRYMLLNGGPHFQQSEAASIVVECETQDEIDRLWDGLIAGGGRESQCGWLKDPWDVNWQITPVRLAELMHTGSPAVAKAVFQAMMGMVKMDIAELERAAAAAESA